MPFKPSKKLLRRPAAINDDVCARQKTGRFRAKIKGELPNIFGFAPTADWDFGQELLIQFGIRNQRRVQFRGERPGADAVDRDGVRSKLKSESANEDRAGRLCSRCKRCDPRWIHGS